MIELEHYTAIVSGLQLKIYFSDRKIFSLLLILSITKNAIDSSDIVPSSMGPNYFTLECCLICISPYFIFSFPYFIFSYFILRFLF